MIVFESDAWNSMPDEWCYWISNEEFDEAGFILVLFVFKRVLSYNDWEKNLQIQFLLW